jgi:hypothetical protein
MATSHLLCTSVYQPLHFESISRPIRLLRINPKAESDTFWDPPRCELLTVDLETAPDYVALSYTWGDLQGDKQAVYINGETCEATENLYSFLCYFRVDSENQNGHTYLWIDQLCINQKDVEERSRTVRFMADIYSRATFVVSWLGHDRETVEAAGFLKDDPIRCAVALLNNPYFTRLWIVQEVILARRVRFLCGTFWVLYEELLDAFVSGRKKVINQIHTRSAIYIMYWSLDERGTPENHRSLIRCVMMYSDNHCSNPRDKVYSLLGLVEKEEVLVVDYVKSVSEVYVDAVRVFANTDYGKGDHAESGLEFVGTSYKLATSMGLSREQLRYLARHFAEKVVSKPNEISDAWFDQLLEGLSSSEQTRQ